MQKDRRLTLPALLVLLAFLSGAGYLVYRASEDALAGEGEDTNATSIGRGPRSPRSAGGEHGWRHHDWTVGPGEGAEYPPGPAPGLGQHRSMGSGTTEDEVYDPQMSAMQRSFQIRGDGGVPLPFSPVERTARIVDLDGSLSVGRNASCQVRVLPVQTMEFNCLVRVVCDGQVLYPNPSQTAGYAPCDVVNGRAMSAVDAVHTAADGDPLVRVDLRSGTVIVEDRGDGVTPFRATLRVGPTG